MNFLKIILPCLLLSFTTFSKAQNTTTFDGVIQMGGKKYQARYDYFIENGDTIFHGPFTLSLEIEKSDDEAGRAHFSAISGNFKENIPHGEWELRQGSFRPSGKAAFRDYRYSFKINGTEFLAKGSFQDGKKNSDWQIYEWKIVNSAVQDTIFSASFPFKNDRIQGKFKVYDKGNYLQGSIDEGQLASGSWQFFSTDNLGNKKIAKEWRFEENQFAEKTAFVNGNKITLELNPGTAVDSLLEKVELNPEILKIIDLKAKLKNPDFAAEYHSILSARDLLFSTLDKYHTIDSTFSPVLRSEISPKIYVKIERHPYTARENELLKNIQANTKKAVVALREIHRDPQINLARISTQKVAFYMSVLNSIEENILEPNKAIVGHLTSGNLEYIDREEFFKTHFDESLVELDAVTVFNNDTTLEVYRLQKININNGSDQMENIASLSGDILSEIRVLSDSIDLYIEEIKREENLSELEGILIDKYEGVRQLSDSLIGSEQNAVAGFDIGHSIIAFADEVLKNYSNIETTEEKMDTVEPTLECLQELEELIKTIHDAPGNINIIREAYTKTVFNPYTFTEMEEKIKPSIYKSFNEVLLPAVLGNINNLRCNNVSGFTENFTLLFEGMIEILKRETGKIERKVKRTKTPSRASDILNFNLRF